MKPITKQGYTTSSYVWGFGLSLVLTLVAYFLTRHHITSGHRSPSDRAMVAALCVLAVSQLIVQLICFLHIQRESKPRWNLMALAFAAMLVLFIVVGSLWIMYHLNYNMTPEQMNHYLQQQDGGI